MSSDKYKNKYFDKKKLPGGDLIYNDNVENIDEKMIFDLSKDYNFTENVQENLNILINVFGEDFYIKDNDIILPVKLKESKLKLTKKKFFILKYKLEKRFTQLNPFKIYFHDFKTGEVNNISYITDIHRTKLITGTKMVNIVINIQKKLKVKRTYLNDQATVMCGSMEMRISPIKMIDKMITFYTKFGFKFDEKKIPYLDKFDDQKQFMKEIKNIVDKIRSLTIADVIKDIHDILDILVQVVKNNDYRNFNIQHISRLDIEPEDYNYQINPHVDVSNLFLMCQQISAIFNNSKDVYVHKHLSNSFNGRENCDDFVDVWGYLTSNRFNIISYKDKTINIEYKIWFSMLETIISRTTYYYDFN